MGDIVHAICKCGYEKELYLGGGMSNFTTVCSFPSYCQECHKLVEINLFNKKIKCTKCKSKKVVPYDQKELISEPGENVVSSWNPPKELGRKLILTDGYYLCPACNKYKMQFHPGGCWD